MSNFIFPLPRIMHESVVHCIIRGEGSENVVLCDFPSYAYKDKGIMHVTFEYHMEFQRCSL